MITNWQKYYLLVAGLNLKNLPNDYQDFDMGWAKTPKEAKCILGHMYKWFGDTVMSEHFTPLKVGDMLWTWLFGDRWKDIDNTINGAISRIEYVVKNGREPENMYSVMYPNENIRTTKMDGICFVELPIRKEQP